jgi:hypothetical protein
MKINRKFKILIKTTIILFFPALYLLIFGKEYYYNESSHEGMAYITYALTFPTSILTTFISYYLLKIDDYCFYSNLIAGIIQYGILPIIFYKLLKRINYKKKDFNLRKTN